MDRAAANEYYGTAEEIEEKATKERGIVSGQNRQQLELENARRTGREREAEILRQQRDIRP
jgi:hypothetical protein